MPKTEINYSNACIYKLVCNDINTPECYVGSTTNFSQRKRSHKSSCNNENTKDYNYYVYQFIRDNGGWDNWSMIEIEKYECKDGRELEARERYYIEHLKAVLNKQVPTRTSKERYEVNKDIRKEQMKENSKKHYEANKEKIAECHKEYREANKEKIAEKRKEWYGANKDDILKKEKERYEANKVKTRYKCVCGSSTTEKNRREHERTKKHQNYINNLKANGDIQTI